MIGIGYTSLALAMRLRYGPAAPGSSDPVVTTTTTYYLDTATGTSTEGDAVRTYELFALGAPVALPSAILPVVPLGAPVALPSAILPLALLGAPVETGETSTILLY